jgi:hypothetical protein
MQHLRGTLGNNLCQLHEGYVRQSPVPEMRVLQRLLQLRDPAG